MANCQPYISTWLPSLIHFQNQIYFTSPKDIPSLSEWQHHPFSYPNYTSMSGNYLWLKTLPWTSYIQLVLLYNYLCNSFHFLHLLIYGLIISWQRTETFPNSFPPSSSIIPFLWMQTNYRHTPNLPPSVVFHCCLESEPGLPWPRSPVLVLLVPYHGLPFL